VFHQSPVQSEKDTTDMFNADLDSVNDKKDDEGSGSDSETPKLSNKKTSFKLAMDDSE